MRCSQRPPTSRDCRTCALVCVCGAPVADTALFFDFSRASRPELLSVCQRECRGHVHLPPAVADAFCATPRRYTAYRALFHRSKATPGEWVLVHGASGAVGQASVQLAVDAGLNVIGTAGSEAGLALVKAAGALFAFNHHDADIASKVKAATGGHGVDVLLEMLANVNLGKDLPMLAQCVALCRVVVAIMGRRSPVCFASRHGRVAVIGSRGEVTVNPRDLMAREASVIGVALGGSTPQDKATAEAYITAKLGNGSLKPVVGAEFDLDTISEAHKSVIEHSGGSSGKVVVKCSAH